MIGALEPVSESRRLKVLISAYACEPDMGSEPGVGWNFVTTMAAKHDVWVLTRANNRARIEAALKKRPTRGLSFVYYDLPRWARWWKRGGIGVQLYYYLWQLGAIRAGRNVHREVGLDVSHHVTFVRYWTPAAAAFVGTPFVWGPVGGGESMPEAFFRELGPAERRYELLRAVMRWLGERDPLVRATCRRVDVGFATTKESLVRIERLTRAAVEELSEVAIPEDDLVLLGSRARVRDGADILFFSAGRLIGWKGYHLSLRAFAEAGLTNARYVMAGDGPMREQLELLVDELGIRERVVFLGAVPRAEVLVWLAKADVFVHPSLHDSGGWATLEAMAAGLPVICLNLGGPATQVTPDSGRSIEATEPVPTIRAIAASMADLAADPLLRVSLGEAARRRVETEYTWGVKAERVAGAYLAAIGADPWRDGPTEDK